MKTVNVRGMEIGAGMPKICVSIPCETQKEILLAGQEALSSGADLIEWRDDWYEDGLNIDKVKETGSALREAVGGMPILFTFRTKKEGGEKEITPYAYVDLVTKAAAMGIFDLVDVELSIGEETAAMITETAHECGVKVVASSHDFEQTPDKEELILRLKKMQALDADLLKIAVMPKDNDDVLQLLDVTREASLSEVDRPIIMVSMGEMGSLSRLAGEVFGSALTFATAGKASAPGQMSVKDVKDVQEMIHESIHDL